MKDLLRSVPRKHWIIAGIIDLVITIVTWSQLFLLVEGARWLAGGFSDGLGIFVIVVYVLTFVFSLLVSTFVVGVFYVVLRIIGPVVKALLAAWRQEPNETEN